MITRHLKYAVVLTILVLMTRSAQASFFIGNAFFSQPPTSEIGSIASSNLIINNAGFSFTVSGVVEVQIPSGLNGGILLEWTVDRELHPTYGSSNIITTTSLTGFSDPPEFGTFGDTSGVTFSALDQYPVVSESTIPLTLTSGVATWNGITIQSTPFFYTSAFGFHYLRQKFYLEGSQLSGPGGLWTIDLPLTSEVTIVPEPSGFLLLLLGVLGTGRRFS